MPATRWSKFYWSDWSDDPLLRMCSLAAQGLWMRLLCIAAQSERPGYVLVNGRKPTPEQLAKLVGESAEVIEFLLSELRVNGALSTSQGGVIFNRRMVKDESVSRKNAENGRSGGFVSRDKQRGIHASPGAPLDDAPEAPPGDAPTQPPTAPPTQPPKRPPEPPAGVHKPEALSKKKLASSSNNISDTPRPPHEVDAVLHELDATAADPKRRATIADAIRDHGAEDVLAAARTIAERPAFATATNRVGYFLSALPDTLAAAAQQHAAEMFDPVRARYWGWLRLLRDKGFWDDNHQGPRPGLPGCQVPKDLIAEVMGHAEQTV